MPRTSQKTLHTNQADQTNYAPKRGVVVFAPPTTIACAGQLDFFIPPIDQSQTPAESQLILSLFPGIDLLGRGFEEEGFCVVRGPDLLWGGDVRRFSVPTGRFTGIIAGSPCQDFSKARRTPPTGTGREMILHFTRVVAEANPEWWILENVPGVPHVDVPGWVTQRLDLRACEFGLDQKRIRHIQLGRRPVTAPIVIPRASGQSHGFEPAAMAQEGHRTKRRGFAAFCALQGIEELTLPGMTITAKYQAVGNGVPVPMARAIAAAIRSWPWTVTRACVCGCGRTITGKERSALPACRKRMERRRRVTAPPGVTL